MARVGLGLGLGNPLVSSTGEAGPFLVALLNFAGADGSTTFTDETGQIWTAVGNAQIDTSLGYNTGLFDGSGDWLTTPDRSAWDFTSGNGTVECICKRTSAADSLDIVVSHVTSSGTAAGWMFGFTSTSLIFNEYNNDAGTTNSVVVTQDTNEHHWAASWNNSNLWLYKNGILLGSFASPVFARSSSTPRIGVNFSTTGFAGHIRALKIIEECLYPDGTSFTPPTAPLLPP